MQSFAFTIADPEDAARFEAEISRDPRVYTRDESGSVRKAYEVSSITTTKSLALVTADGDAPFSPGPALFGIIRGDAGRMAAPAAGTAADRAVHRGADPAGPPVPAVHRGLAVAVDTGPGRGMDRWRRVGAFDSPLL